MADLGSLVIKLSAETSEFRADLGRTARLLDRHANDMKSSLGQVAAVAKTTFGVVIGAASVGALRDFIDRTLEASASLQQLSEQTGASTTALSGLAPVATISGTAMETIGANLSKLSKALAGIDDEGADASKALQFLGVTAKDSGGKLRDPAEVLNDVAVKLAEFEDGAGKTALAMDLFGKSGAAMLPFLKDLAENQTLNIRLTAQQIEEADKAAKALARMRAEGSFVSQTLVTSAIPAMSVLAEEFKKIVFGADNAVGGIARLRDDGTLARWAESSATAVAVLADSLRVIFQAIKAIGGSFRAVWADIELAGGFIARGAIPGLVFEDNRKALREALEGRNLIVEEANRNYVELWNMPLLADAVTQRFDEMRRVAQAGSVAQAGTVAQGDKPTQGDKPARPALQYSTAAEASRTEALAGIERDVKRLQDALDVESGILKDRQRVIDLYEGQGYLTFQEGSAARLVAQEEFTERLRANMAEEEAILKRGLATVATTVQEKARLSAKLEDLMARGARLEREVNLSGLERSIREPGETFKTTLADIEQRSKALAALADDEAAILRARQRVIDLYQEQGTLRFKQATDLRINVQAEFLERSRTHFDQEAALLRTALDTVVSTAEQRRQIEERLGVLAAKRERMEREAAQLTLERAIRSPFEALRDIQERASRAESEFKTREEQVRLLRESGAISELESLRRLATAREESARQLERLSAEARAIVESTPGNDRFAESMRQIAEAARTAATGAKELGQRAREIAEPYAAGFQKGLKSFIEDAEAMGKHIESVTTRAFTGMTDALTRFVMTGKLDFRSLANSIVSDLIRIQIQNSVMKPLAQATAGVSLAGGFSGAGKFLSDLFKADGGPVARGQPYIVGEEGPEWFVPAVAGTIVPGGRSVGAPVGSDIATAAPQAPININFSVRAMDARSFQMAMVQNKAVVVGIVNQALNMRGRNGITA